MIATAHEELLIASTVMLASCGVCWDQCQAGAACLHKDQARDVNGPAAIAKVPVAMLFGTRADGCLCLEQ